MRATALLALVATLATCCPASDLTLTDGRVLRNATVLGYSGSTVTVQSEEGAEEVALDLLPSALRAQYAPASRPAAARTPGAQLIMQLAGDGTMKSAPFRVSGKWRVRWSATAKPPRTLGPALLVSVIGADGVGVYAYSTTERMGPGETWGTGSGSVQLTVAGMECTWSVYVEQF